MSEFDDRFDDDFDDFEEDFEDLDDDLWEDWDYDPFDDSEADADTLRSAGFGTDEDYGLFGPDEYDYDHFG